MPGRRKKTINASWVVYLALHTHIGAGLALVVVGFVDLTGSSPTSSDLTLWKVGTILLLLAFLVIYAAFFVASAAEDPRIRVDEATALCKSRRARARLICTVKPPSVIRSPVCFYLRSLSTH